VCEEQKRKQAEGELLLQTTTQCVPPLLLKGSLSVADVFHISRVLGNSLFMQIL
jgi:uncharacterized sodium:solute symporter family permease YidK